MNSSMNRVMDSSLTVSQLVARIRQDLETGYRQVTVVGEISSFKPWRSGHWYFDLKDEQATLPSVMFKGSCDRVKFEVQDGLQVLLTGRVSVYLPQSKIQLIVESMEPVGSGALALAFEQLKQKLEREGFFDSASKKPIPFFPKVLGIVTSPQGAALQDMLRILKHRMPGQSVLLSPARVQGQGAAEELAIALKRLESQNCDLIIIGRGGGSLEDLWAFNEEVLARAIYACKTPIISAVGHETDFTIADFVADLRCATPTHAAQTAVPDKAELRQALKRFEARLHKQVQATLNRMHLLLERLSKRFVSPKVRLLTTVQRLDALAQKLEKVLSKRLQSTRERMVSSVTKLEALSPLKVLARGYGAVFFEGHVVSKLEQVHLGSSVDVRLSNGILGVEVKSKDGL
ncbi:MAG: exodeoxyribonuclease VII large subunit [Myxococcaceae bacterium]|nr:exodeoxyribonuclease VII large subunit [Myxococcaceae bacterium]